MRIIGMKTTVSYAIFICSILLSICSFAAQTAAPFTTAYRYDMGGQLTGTILADPDGSGLLGYPATRNTYNSRGLLEREEVGELVSWQDESIVPSSWSTPTQFKIETTKIFYYDDFGRKTIQARLNKQGTTETLVQFNYDHLDRINCKTLRLSAKNFMPATYSSLPDACTPNNSVYGKDRVTQYAYNNIGQVETETRALGTSLAQIYVKNVYGDYGLLKQQIDANGNLTELEYDAQMRLYRRYYPSKTILVGQSPSNPGTPNKTDGFNEYRYDLNGNINYERKRNGKVITYSHDNNNRMILKDLVDNTYSQDIDYDYDLRGLTLHSKFGSSSGQGVTNSFDGFGNLEISTINMAGNSRTLNYAYDANGNRERITHPDSKYFTYEFDGINRINRLKENGPDIVLNIDYRTNGRRSNIFRSGGATTTYVFDDVARIKEFQQTFSDSTKNLATSFIYSPANQVIELTYSNSLYHYQGNENRTGVYIPNGLNQYDRINNQPIDHDTNGNLVNDGSQMYVFDDENRLMSTSGAATSSFKYDPLGRLFETTINGTKTQYLYDGDALVAEYNGITGALEQRYVHGDQVDEPLVQYAGSSVTATNRRYLHANHQGSIIAHSTNIGTVSSTLTYDGYGIPSVNNTGRFGYTGQIWFKELGLFHYKARMYSPKLGRFMQTDPIFYEDDMNMYAYVGNDPVNKTDPTGKYARGSGWSDDQWKKFEAAQKTAAAAMTKSASTLKQTAADMRAGKDVSAPKGAEGASAKDMDKMASKLEAGAKALNDNGKLGYVASQGKVGSGDFAKADVGGKTMRVDASDSAFGNNRNTSFMAGHESLHNAGLVDQTWAGWTAYRSSGDPWERKAYEKLSAEERSENPDHIMSIVYP